MLLLVDPSSRFVRPHGGGIGDSAATEAKLKDKKKKAKLQNSSGAVLFQADSEEGARPV